ncbi:hypothetical protein ACFYQA_37505 [Streptomyces sp. NPDC005774]|uniref:hypothetical protein n=1 Tax=Streptomyces sp. NPDC005774 TaxID=3364728 RepID=UPI0036A70E38
MKMMRHIAIVLTGLVTAGFFAMGTAAAAPTDSGPQEAPQEKAALGSPGDLLSGLLGGVKQTLGQGL